MWKTLWFVILSGPYIVYMLNEMDILEDWAAIRKVLLFFLCNLLCDWLIFELRCWITNRNLWIFNKTYLELRPYCTRYALVIQPVTCYGSSREELGSRWGVNVLLLLPNGFFFIVAKFLDGFWWKIALEHRISSETSPMVPSTNV